MPGGDGTGPMGFGPMTGRAAGYCAGFPVPGSMNPGGGRGWGRGRGGGWGRGWGRGRGAPYGYAYGPPAWGSVGGPAPLGPTGGYAYGPPAWGPVGGPAPLGPTGEQEAEALKRQAEFLTGSLEEIQKRLSELEAKEGSK